MNATPALMVLSFPLAAMAGYWMLAQTHRNGDGPYLAIFVAVTVWLGVFLLGLSTAI